MVHPSAVVHPKAEIGTKCDIGPFCIVGEHVVLGEGCRLVSHVVLDGHTRLGNGNVVYPFTTIGLPTQDLKYKGGTTYTQLGDNNVIREGVTINSATGEGEVTFVGSSNSILAGSHVAHNCRLGNNIVVSSAAVAGHVLVEDGAIVGGRCAIHQFCRIGKMSMIAGCAKVVQDVAPFMLVDGNPAQTVTVNKVALDRQGAPDATLNALRQTYKIMFREGLTIGNALARIEQDVPQVEEVQHFVRFVKASERGITRYDLGKRPG
jgi:UDP-N-acetylglucosamine acyltransferase